MLEIVQYQLKVEGRRAKSSVVQKEQVSATITTTTTGTTMATAAGRTIIGGNARNLWAFRLAQRIIQQQQQHPPYCPRLTRRRRLCHRLPFLLCGWNPEWRKHLGTSIHFSFGRIGRGKNGHDQIRHEIFCGTLATKHFATQGARLCQSSCLSNHHGYQRPRRYIDIVDIAVHVEHSSHTHVHWSKSIAIQSHSRVLWKCQNRTQWQFFQVWKIYRNSIFKKRENSWAQVLERTYWKRYDWSIRVSENEIITFSMNFSLGGMDARQLSHYFIAPTAHAKDFKLTASGTYDWRYGVTDQETYKALRHWPTNIPCRRNNGHPHGSRTLSISWVLLLVHWKSHPCILL